ncbi:hypothetical protein GLW08_13425 [Pontibacillus yanchengensis]|uniref:Uncharacterized protein n=1 Tax=Pontibacillus yanchengensis TaxID=462910 RepID=A0ACC7VI79_9BACI|nr:hypothetical protein [Pontibacillus yanchengensis]MYL54330.1 hypothetical protein [Pontibacillus yanchengensis]
MMTKLSSLDELYDAKAAIEQLISTEPKLHEKLIHVVSLTRQLQIQYHYMGCLLMDDDPCNHTPTYVKSSVLELYHEEIERLKQDSDFAYVQQLFINHQKVGYPKISLLVLGAKPEKIKGSTIIK